MRHLRLPIALFIAVAILFSSTAQSFAASAPGSSESASAYAVKWTAEPEECKFLGLINDHRKANGLKAVTISVTLSAAAENHSLDMAKNNYFDHNLSGGTTWQQNIANYGYPSDTFRAENIAAGRGTAAEVFKQWKESPGHNKNMLSPKVTAIGIGRVAGQAGSDYNWYWTNTFGSKVDVAYTCSSSMMSSSDPAGTVLPIAGGGRTSASSNSALAYDNNMNTAWSSTSSSAPKSAFIYFDLGSAKNIGQIQWLFSQNGSADSFQVQISSDKTNWTKVTSRTAAKAGSWQAAKVNKKARYVRFYFENPNKDAVLGYLSEVKIVA